MPKKWRSCWSCACCARLPHAWTLTRRQLRSQDPVCRKGARQGALTVGRHRLQSLLGCGGFGMVWLVHDDLLDAPVAVKVMAEKWVHRPDLRERFLDEARLLRQAASDRVVQVYDIGELPDGRPYFVMTYADGGTLADRVAQGPLAVDQALRFAVQAARGVADLHAVGIVICTSVPTATSAWSTRA
ncbi:protein kinase [Streptomyces sp. NPDC001797]|uniref:protein kinase domain-containing protein n=1 Tax=Streptomyces sp. NPDC001797 TaxID=3364610 RepID=UPI0036C12251